jgi:predicted permease
MSSVLSEIYSTFSASIRSVGTACTLAAVGIYLHRRGFIIGDGKRTLALISQQVTIPLLFFTKIIYCNQDWSTDPCPDVTQSLRDVWMLLLWPAYVVGVGFAVGYGAAKVSNTPPHQVRAVLVACGFGNSTGLPITLLTVVHSNFPSTSDLGRIDPCLFLSVYLLLYPVLQWGVGGWLLAPESSTGSKQRKRPSSKKSQRRSSGLAHNVLNQPTTELYQWSHRGIGETDASMYMSVQDNLNQLYQQGPMTNGQIQPESEFNPLVKTESMNSIGMDLSRENSMGLIHKGGSREEQTEFFEQLKEESAATTVLNDKTSLLLLEQQMSKALTSRSSSSSKNKPQDSNNEITEESSSWDGDDDSSQQDDDENVWDTMRQVAARCLQPPVVGALAGMLVASQPALRGVFVDLVDRSDDAPMEWMFDALHTVGQSAVPINMMILGCNLSASYHNDNDSSKNNKEGEDDDDGKSSLFSNQTMLAILIGKMLVMPVIGFLSALFFRTYVWNIPDDIAGSFYLVVMIVFLTPTANNVMVMVELSGSGSKAGIARIIAWQYAAAPILLSLTMTAAVGIADQWS